MEMVSGCQAGGVDVFMCKPNSPLNTSQAYLRLWATSPCVHSI